MMKTDMPALMALALLWLLMIGAMLLLPVAACERNHVCLQTWLSSG